MFLTKVEFIFLQSCAAHMDTQSERPLGQVSASRLCVEALPDAKRCTAVLKIVRSVGV